MDNLLIVGYVICGLLGAILGTLLGQSIFSNRK